MKKINYGMDITCAEQILLAEAVERGTLEFLEQSGISQDSFWTYRDHAIKMWEVYEATGKCPSRSSIESFEMENNKRKPLNWEYSEEDVTEALYWKRKEDKENVYGRVLLEARNKRKEEGYEGIVKFLLEKLPEVVSRFASTSDDNQIESLNDLVAMEFPPIKWVIPGMIPEGLALLSGREKIGKSTLILGLGISVATGGMALGSKSVEKGNVLGLFLEDNYRRIQTRVKKMITGRIVDLSNFNVRTEFPRVDEGGYEKLDRYLSEHPDNRLVIIDTLKMWKSNKSSNKGLYEQDYDSVAPLRDLAQKHNTAILVIHHNNKAESTENPFDAISGSTGLLGATNTNIVLQKLKDGKGLTYNIAGHDIEEPGKFALIYDPMTWNFRLDDNPDKYETSEERTEILEVIREAGEPQSPKDIEDEIGKPCRELIRKMVNDDQLIRVGYGKYDLPSRGTPPVDNDTSSSTNNPRDNNELTNNNPREYRDTPREVTLEVGKSVDSVDTVDSSIETPLEWDKSLGKVSTVNSVNGVNGDTHPNDTENIEVDVCIVRNCYEMREVEKLCKWHIWSSDERLQELGFKEEVA